MHIGVVLPQTEIGDQRTRCATTQRASSRSDTTTSWPTTTFSGPTPRRMPPWTGPYNVDTTFHEPFVLFGYLAGLCTLELVTGIIILPQRQTALVAKQAAEVDLLTGGHFRLGVGLGWNSVEYDALGKNFHDRGRRIGEQVQLLRKLTSERSVRFKGVHESVDAAGIAPLPIQRPIPIWFGANSQIAFRRAGRLADGWFPQQQPGAGLEEAKVLVDEAARLAGRDPATLGMEGRLRLDPANPDALLSSVESWRSSGATHLSINTMSLGFATVDEHIEALAGAARAMGLSS